MLKRSLAFLFLSLFFFSPLEAKVKIITEKDLSDIAVIDVWVRAGSRNESAEINGISHFLEHLIFKGSKKYKTGEMDKLIEECGGIVNAATSKDFTHFYVTVPKEYFYRAADIMSDSITNPLFPEEEIEKERKEEILRSQSQPDNELYDLIYAKCFRLHPYHYSVLGTVPSLLNIKKADITNYKKKFYVDSNMTVLAAGNLPNDAAGYLSKAFSGLPGGKRTENLEAETLFQNSLLEKKKKVNKTYLAVAFSSPSAQSPDSYTMDVISMIMGSGRNSRLNKELKENKQLVWSIGFSYPTPIDQNLVLISAVCDAKKVEKATEAIFTELRKLATQPVKPAELEKAKTIIEVDYKVTHSNPQSLASNLGYFATVINAEYEKNYLENIKKVTADDILRVTKQYFSYYTIGRIIGEN